MVRMAGFEPALSWSRTKHFTKLSYILLLRKEYYHILRILQAGNSACSSSDPIQSSERGGLLRDGGKPDSGNPVLFLTNCQKALVVRKIDRFLLESFFILIEDIVTRFRLKLSVRFFRFFFIFKQASQQDHAIAGHRLNTFFGGCVFPLVHQRQIAVLRFPAGGIESVDQFLTAGGCDQRGR